MNLKYEIIDNKFYNIKEILKVKFEISDRLLVKLKKNNRILLNSIPSYVDHKVNIGDTLEVNLDFDEISENIIPIKMVLDILYEDEALLIINKPFGIPVHPSMSHYDNSLSNGVKFYFDTINLKRKIRPVNRLDKNTSGIVIFAKNEYVQEALVKQMKTKKFVKEYLAVLENHLETPSGTIYAPISRKENSIIEREVNFLGETAITHFELIKNFEIENTNQKLSLVKFKLETGRTHQIRVHSKHISHPILGDSLYGNSSSLITRQALHAYKVNFIHPISKKEINIEIDLPEDMKTVLE